MGAAHGSPRYEIKDRFRALREWRGAAIVLAALIVVCGGAELIFGDGHGTGWLWSLGVIAVVSLIVIFWNGIAENEPELVVERPGVRIDEAKVPWPSIRQIVVLGPDGADGTVEIGLRLRFGAPLPDGMDHVIYDPRDPDALHCDYRLRADRLDTARLDAAVRAFAPPDVRVVAGDPARVHRPARPDTSGPRQDAPATVLAVRMRDHGGGEAGNLHVYKPYPVVGFTLPDGRQVVAQVGKPGQGRPGEQVMVSYDADDPADVWVHGGKPKSVRRFTSLPGAS